MNLKMNSQKAGANTLELKEIFSAPMNTIMSISLRYIVPATTDNNRLAQRPKGKQKRFIIASLDSGVFVSQAHNVKLYFIP